MDHLLKTKKEFKNLKKHDIQTIFTEIYWNELDKAFFQHDLAYGDFKDWARRAASDKVLKDKAFSIAKNPKDDRHQRGISSMVYKFFDRKSAGSGVNMHTNNRRPLDLDEELHCLCNGLLLENLKEEQFIQDLKTIFGVLI